MTAKPLPTWASALMLVAVITAATILVALGVPVPSWEIALLSGAAGVTGTTHALASTQAASPAAASPKSAPPSQGAS